MSEQMNNDENLEHLDHEDYSQESSYWESFGVVKEHLSTKPDFSKNFIFLSIIGTTVTALGAAFSGHVIRTSRLLEKFPAQDAIYFLQEWGSSFSVWHLKFIAVLAVPGIVALSYVYLSYLEKMLNPSSEKVEEPEFFEKLQTHLVSFTTVPFLILGTFAIGFGTKLSGLGAGSQFIAAVPAFIVSWLAFGIVLKSYLMSDRGWGDVLKAAAPGALFFELSKYAGIGIFFWSSSAPLVANLFTLAFLAVAWNVAAAYAYVYGGCFGYHTAGGTLLRKDRFGAMSSGGFRAMREIGIIALVEISRRLLRHDNVGIDAEELGEISNVSDIRAQQVLNHLESVGLVRQMKTREGYLVSILTYAPDQLSLKKVVDAIEQREKLRIGEIAYSKWFWSEYYQALDEKFDDVTLRDLVEDQKLSKLAA